MSKDELVYFPVSHMPNYYGSTAAAAAAAAASAAYWLPTHNINKLPAQFLQNCVDHGVNTKPTNNPNCHDPTTPMNLVTNSRLPLSLRQLTPTILPSSSTLTSTSNSIEHIAGDAVTVHSIINEKDVDGERNVDVRRDASASTSASAKAKHTNFAHSPTINMDVSLTANFPLNYPNLYGISAASLYTAPTMFSNIINPTYTSSYVNAMPTHSNQLCDSNSISSAYLKAIQAAAACSIYNPAVMPFQVNSNLFPAKYTDVAPNTLNSMNFTTALALSTTHDDTQGVYTRTEIQPCNNSYSKSKIFKPTSTSAPTTHSSSNNDVYLQERNIENLTKFREKASSESHFKIPTGKEGSLKHRLLRPNKSEDHDKPPIMKTYNTTKHFKKGTYIELANGSLRRVEDMRTEDFIQCAERSPCHELTESTVVKINTALPNNNVVITFSYNKNRSKIDMEVVLEHPFFVYGQGWASCHPEQSLTAFGLKCQRLQVGDICISLMQRDTSKIIAQPHFSCINTQNFHNFTHATIPEYHFNGQVLQYNSHGPYCGSVVSPSINRSTLSFTKPPILKTPETNHHTHSSYAEMAKMMSPYTYRNNEAPPVLTLDSAMQPTSPNSSPKTIFNTVYGNYLTQLSCPTSIPAANKLMEANTICRNGQQIEQTGIQSISSLKHTPQNYTLQSSDSYDQRGIQDTVASRKRRWSAPENTNDDDNIDMQTSRRIQFPNNTSNCKR